MVALLNLHRVNIQAFCAEIIGDSLAFVPIAGSDNDCAPRFCQPFTDALAIVTGTS